LTGTADEELYQEIILDHYRHPRGRGPCEGCARRVQKENPLCGDEILLGVDLGPDGRIARIAFEGSGCAISQASASMMTEAVKGLAAPDAAALVEKMRSMMHGAPSGEELGDLAALEGVSRFATRVKCALLPWSALAEALADAGVPPAGGGNGS
jgi:nitrogen fixation NifU-like protein